MQFPSFPEELEKVVPKEDLIKNEPSTVSSQWLGLVAYEESLKLQKIAWEFVKKTNSILILGLEHHPVITIGRKSDVTEIKATKEELDKLNITTAKTDRGGMATIHSPGQLVIYPIFPLKYFNIGVRHFILLMEHSTRELVAQYDIKIAESNCNPGVYTSFGKIASMGFRIEQGVSRHGISINVNNDLTLFSTIRACGKDSETFDRLKHYKKIETVEVFNAWVKIFEPNLLDLLNHVR